MKIRKGRTVQQMLGIRRFTRYGLLTQDGELLFFRVAPTNISVLSKRNIAVKLDNLHKLLASVPDLAIVSTDSCECFDANKVFLRERIQEETNPKVRSLLERDLEMLTEMQAEMATARQFVCVKRCKGLKPDQVFHEGNQTLQAISDHGFVGTWMSKADIKRMLATYFDASMDGDRMPDVDGAQYLDGGEDS